MFSKVHSVGINGIDGYPVDVEADASDGLPGFVMVGVLASEVREAQDRVRTALRNSGYRLSSKKVTINLSPADRRKSGTAFDLPIAAAVLGAFGIAELSALKETVLMGELGLDGKVKPIRGVLSMVMAAKEDGKKRCILPRENMAEGLLIPEMEIVGIETLIELVYLLCHPLEIQGERLKEEGAVIELPAYAEDFSEVRGQLLLRRATEIAVAGQHNILYIGPAGSGKSMVAQRIPTIMPSLSREEYLEIARIYSICGEFTPSSPAWTRRPFRSPHHSLSPQALAGGGRNPKPGELSLASRGVLFLDEFPEFQKRTVETLRQPMEEGRIVINRVHGSCEFPTHFMLAAAMNPCLCGHYPDRSKCHCTEAQIRGYLRKVSKPILDRVDICVEAAPISYDELKSTECSEDSKSIRARVEQAGKIQAERFCGMPIHFNSRMSGADIRQHCKLVKADEQFFKKWFQEKEMSARAYGKILKVARTIADLEGSRDIHRHHLCEAIGYRSLEDKYWGAGEAYGGY